MNKIIKRSFNHIMIVSLFVISARTMPCGDCKKIWKKKVEMWGKDNEINRLEQMELSLESNSKKIKKMASKEGIDLCFFDAIFSQKEPCEINSILFDLIVKKIGERYLLATEINTLGHTANPLVVVGKNGGYIRANDIVFQSKAFKKQNRKD